MNMPFKKSDLLNFRALDALQSGGELPGTRRQRRLAIVVAVVWFFLCLAWGAPASLLGTLLKPFAPQLELQAPEGSFWNGRAGAANWRVGEHSFALGSVEWHLSAWSLLWLHPSLHVATKYGDQFVDAHVRLSPLGTVQLSDVRAALPVGALTQGLPLRTDGLLGLRFERTEMARDGQLRELQGEVQWQSAAAQWNSRWVALGDYTIAMTTPKNGQLQLQIDGQGALAASGTAGIDLGARTYTVQGQLTPAATLPQEMRDGVGPMLGGQRDAQGHWQIKRDGKW